MKNLCKLQIFEIPRSFLYQGQLHPETLSNFLKTAQLISTLAWKIPPVSSGLCLYGSCVWLSFEARG